jgi:hypothetical protein
MSEQLDPIPSSVRAILALFSNELAEARFGDLDASSLDALAEETLEKAQALERAREALEEARAELDQARGELARRAEQGLEYARIFAQSDAGLRARIDALAPEKQTPRQKTKRGKKSEEPEELLFESDQAAE